MTDQPVRPKVVAILGPTASGKSALGMALATRLDGEIICCDSVQVYRGMDICSGKPTLAEQQLVPHHLLDLVQPDEHFHAAAWADKARAAIAEICARGRLPVIVGGTGLYYRALTQGFFEAPPPDWQLRAQHKTFAETHGLATLHERLRTVDPEAAARIHATDLLRISRALEIYEQTGVPITELQSRAQPIAPPNPFVVLLDPPMPVLVRNIGARVEEMLEQGLLAEVTRLRDAGFAQTRAFQGAIGYQSLLAHLEGSVSRDAAVDEMKRLTVQYARRQRTWFRKEKPRHRFEGQADVEALANEIAAWVNCIT